MATRTQKAAMKKAAGSKPKSAPKSKAPKPAAKPKAAKPAAAKAGKGKSPKPVKAKAPTADAEAPDAELLPEPKRTSFSERFWHRLGLRAQKKEAEAHQHEAELEAAEARAETERLRRERDERKAKTAAERRKEAAAAREMKRIAEEEAIRLQEDEARKAKEAKLSRAERARAAREAKAAEEAAARREAAREEQERLQREQHDREVEAAAAEAEAMLAAAKAKRIQPQAEEADDGADTEEPEPEPEPAKPMVTMRPSPAARAAEQEADEDEEGEAVEIEDPTPTRTAAKAPPPRPEPVTELDRQADKVAEELMARRSKPITIDVEDEAVPTLPVGRKTRPAEGKEVLQLDPAPPAHIPEMHAPRGLSIPEHFILLAIEETWDERTEKAKAGALGGGLTGALLLDLVLHGKVKVQRDRFQLTDVPVDDASAAVVAKLRQIGDRPSLQAMGELAKWLRQLLPAYKDRMASRGLIAYRTWRHLGLFYRSQTALLDPEAQERLRNKLARAIAGGGRPDAPTILSLGLLEASGLFGVVVPEGAQAYNRKRLNGLLGGKDVMGYKVDDELKGTQEMAVRTILDNVRLMTTRG